jgi:hypothetical protein
VERAAPTTARLPLRSGGPDRLARSASLASPRPVHGLARRVSKAVEKYAMTVAPVIVATADIPASWIWVHATGLR